MVSGMSGYSGYSDASSMYIQGQTDNYQSEYSMASQSDVQVQAMDGNSSYIDDNTSMAGLSDYSTTEINQAAPSNKLNDYASDVNSSSVRQDSHPSMESDNSIVMGSTGSANKLLRDNSNSSFGSFGNSSKRSHEKLQTVD